MEYRDQLKYIKAHEIGDSPDHKGKRPKKGKREKPSSRKSGVAGRLLWILQLVSSAFFLLSIVILGILPVKYMVVLAVILLLLLLLSAFMERRKLRSRKRKSGGKGLSLATSILFLGLGIYVMKANGTLDKISVGEENGAYSEIHAAKVTKEPFNVYISGIDVYGEITKESRSDVNLIATVNPETHKILLTTTPRDYYVKIPGISGEQKDKLTHAGIYGIDASLDTLESLYDTEIPFYVRVNFTSVEQIVDVLGGVDIESELAFTTGKNTGAVVEVQKGKNHFDGKQALAFVRERHALAEGDNQRGKNQQALLTGIIKKVASPAVLFHANGIMDSVSDNAETNMSEAQIKSLVRAQINDMEEWDVESVAATGKSSGKQYCYSYSGAPLSVIVPDENSVAEIQEKIKAVMGHEEDEAS